MKLPAASEMLFSLKSFSASMLALYLAFRIGLPRPFWAMMTAYVVASPLSGAVRSKALYRVGGTILGSAATIFLVPRLANSPELLSIALACWVGICLYVSLLDRTPRSYVFMLAGYTAALIGFPAVGDPASIFDVALARVEEITLGILCATLVHSLVFPQSLGPVLLMRLDRAIGDAQQWICHALAVHSTSQDLRGRRTLAGDITELRLMTTHLPFDTSNLRWTSSAIHALQDRLAAMVPLVSAVEDRLHALREADTGDLSPREHALLKDIADWVQDAHATPERAAQLHAAIAAVTPSVGRDASWSDLLKVNLAARLRSLMDAYADCRNLRRQIDAGFRGAASAYVWRQPALSPRALHRDHGLALLSSVAAVIAIVGCCAFWIATAWPSGSAAAMMAAVFCCLFASQDDPAPGIKLFLSYTLQSIPISALYLLVVLPAVHSFEMLVLTTAPVFLWLGIYVARPQTSGRAMGVLFGVVGMLGLQDTGTADMVSFINGMLAQLAGIAAAAIFTKLLRSVNAGWTARRLVHAGWSELARLGSAERAPSIAAVNARMLDRIGLLTPRLAMAGPRQDLSAVDALGDLRVSLNMTKLLHIQPRLEQQQVPLRGLIQELSNHFRNRPTQPATAEPGLLARLDASLGAVCAAPADGAQRDAVAALTGIRRDLFPAAAAYQPVTRPQEEFV